MKKVNELLTYDVMLDSLIVGDNADKFTESAKSGPKVFL